MSPHDRKRESERRLEADDHENPSRSAEDTASDLSDVDDDPEDVEDHSSRLKIAPGESDDYDEWRREHRGKGRKRRSKRGGRQRQSRDDDRT